MSWTVAVAGGTALVALCGLTVAGAASGSAPLHARLASADTVITIEAGEAAPRLRSLARRGAAPWLNQDLSALPGQLYVHGRVRSLIWHLDRAATRFGPRELDVVYVAEAPHLRLDWQWRARAAHGPLEHSTLIRNLSDEAVELPLPPSLVFDWQIPPQQALERFWVEKGADTPSAAGTHRDPLNPGDTWTGRSSTYARPRSGELREMIPYVLVEAPGGARAGWYLGIESGARTQIQLVRDGASLRGGAGLDAQPGRDRTRLLPLEPFETPTIFLGASAGGPDAAGNVLRHWERAVLDDPRTLRDRRFPLLVSNSWGSGMAVDETLARRLITETSRLGLEMFHLDAGWFRDVGDWRADPVKFPHGLADLADFAHRHGEKFGLWMDWTQAGTSAGPGALNVADPVVRQWLIADPPAGWTHAEPYKGITLDLGVPAVQAWAARELERVVHDYHLDMLEHDGYLVAQGSSRTDHPAMAPDPATVRVYEDSGYVWADGSNATDVSHRATVAYYALYRQLRASHPALLLEVCNDGGRMVDFGSAAHGDYFSITDTYDPLSNRRAFYDASQVLPPAMLESYVASWPAPRMDNFRYQLRSGMLGAFSLMLDPREWSPARRAAARREFALYKTALRPLIREADVYHVAERPDGVHWDGIEYYSAALGRGVLYAFRGTVADEPAHRYRLRGLERRGRYRLGFHDRGARSDRVVSGRHLMRAGLAVALPEPLSSELVFIERIR